MVQQEVHIVALVGHMRAEQNGSSERGMQRYYSAYEEMAQDRRMKRKPKGAYDDRRNDVDWEHKVDDRGADEVPAEESGPGGFRCSEHFAGGEVVDVDERTVGLLVNYAAV